MRAFKAPFSDAVRLRNDLFSSERELEEGERSNGVPGGGRGARRLTRPHREVRAGPVCMRAPGPSPFAAPAC